MGTTAVIGVTHDDEKYLWSTEYGNGDLDLTGVLLLKSYNSYGDALALVAMGDSSYLEETLEDSVFYHRDRDEDWRDTKPREGDFEEFNKKVRGEIYGYLWSRSEWWVYHRHSNMWCELSRVRPDAYNGWGG